MVWRWRKVGRGKVSHGRGWALLGRVLYAGIIGWARNMGGGVVTDNVPVEIVKIDACTTTSEYRGTVTTSGM